MDKETLVFSLGSLIALVVILATEPLYNQSLFSWSITEIPVVQSNTTTVGFAAWEIYSTGCLVIACAAPIVIPLI